MNEPERLLDGEASDLVRTMISAAREEEPSRRVLHRTLLAVGAGAAVIGVSAAAGGAAVGAGEAGAATSFGLVAKWLGIGAAAGLVTAGAAMQVERHFVDAPRAAMVAPAANAQSPGTAAVERAPVAAPAVPAPAAAPPKTPRAPGALPAATAVEPLLEEDDPSLNAEVAALDRARKAIASGSSDRALAELGAYDKEFPSGRLGPEALFLRMEAADKRGDRAAAERAARELLANHPKSPHAARARAVIAGAKNP